MKKVQLYLIISTLYVFLYATTPYWTAECVTIVMFSLSPMVVLSLVWVILKKGRSSKLTFEDAFYEDYPAKT